MRATRWAPIALALTGISAMTIAVVSFEPRPFEAGFEESGLSGNDWQVDADSRCQIATSASHSRDGSQSLSISAPQDDRCELVPRMFPPYQDKLFREPFGEDRWYRFSVLVADLGEALAPIDEADNTIVAQWHASPDFFFGREAGRGPPLALRIHGGHWRITYGWDASLRSKQRYLTGNWQQAGRVEIGRWVDWKFHVRWSYGDGGLTEVWRDGHLVLQRSGPNAYNDFRGVYLKLGLYHPTGDSTVFLDRVAVGDADW